MVGTVLAGRIRPIVPPARTFGPAQLRNGRVPGTQRRRMGLLL